MALRPLTPAEHEGVRRMKRYQLIVLGIVLCIMIALAVARAAGDTGTDPVLCGGPGERWLAEYSDDWVSECTYRYQPSSVLADDGRAFRARMTIEWDVTWASSTGAGGVLAPISSTSVTPIEVRETTVLR